MRPENKNIKKAKNLLYETKQ